MVVLVIEFSTPPLVEVPVSLLLSRKAWRTFGVWALLVNCVSVTSFG